MVKHIMPYFYWLFGDGFINWISENTYSILISVSNYSNLLSAIGAILAALVALYLGDWKARFDKPVLKLSFQSNNKYPYFHTLSFEPYSKFLRIDGLNTHLYCPGFNARIGIFNAGKTTAQNVEAKVEKIEFYKNGKEISEPRYYHPTTVKWSGEREWNSINIVPKSYFLMDLFWAKNETITEISKFNSYRINAHGVYIEEDVLRQFVENFIEPTEEIYWNVWVDTSYDRGLPLKYNIQGDLVLHFFVNADNCSPVRFQVHISWYFENWNQPVINVIANDKVISHDIFK